MLYSVSKFNRRYIRCSFVNSVSRAYELFILQLNPLSTSAANAQKPYSEDANQHTFAANHLKNTHGFSPERAVMYSKYLKFDSTERPDSVIAFFKKHHFSDAQISRVVRRWPIVFNYFPEPKFVPKIEFLRSLGFSSSDIVKILTRNPRLLSRSLESQIIPGVDFLRSFLHSDKDVIFAIMRFPGIFLENLQETLMVNVGILREVGVPKSHISVLLKRCPSGIAVVPDSFRETLEEAKRLGFNPQKKMFIHAIIVMRELSCLTWKEKIKFYERWGLSENEVMDAFKKYPRFMSVSLDKCTRTMDFLVNEMACDVWVLMRRPQIFSFSFHKTIAPRCAIYRVLVLKGLIKEESSLAKTLRCSQRSFLEKYVMRFEKEAPELLKIYQGVYPTQA